jgi:hypothetical protein
MPVWEITGAEFTALDAHTSGISVRFPRVTKVRDDKTIKESTTLQELKVIFFLFELKSVCLCNLIQTLFENSRHGTDVSSLFGNSSKDANVPGPSPKKVNHELYLLNCEISM